MAAIEGTGTILRRVGREREERGKGGGRGVRRGGERGDEGRVGEEREGRGGEGRRGGGVLICCLPYPFDP